jgi:ABC-type lipoprotein export system ATPase subunit
LIHLRGVTKSFDGAIVVHALQAVDLDIVSGEYIAVVGPSGSGKSSLLHLLGLLDRPTSGLYEFDATDVSRLSERRRTALRARSIGFVFQAFHLLPGRTSLENVVLGEIYGGWRRAGRLRRAAESLDQVGLSHRSDFDVERLSGGEKQRVAIARALMGSPRLLLCDEPTGNLDSENGKALLRLLDRLNQSGITIVLVTHDATVASAARRQIQVLDGQIIDDRGTRAAA